MTAKQITVRMPKTVWDKWEAEMLDPNNKQAVGTLFDGQGYCCLGLLQKAVDGEVERFDFESLEKLQRNVGGEYDELRAGDARLVPSRGWLAKHGIEFKQKGMEYSEVPSVLAPLDFHGSRYPMVSELNDEGVTFPVICELIRNHLETY